MHYVAERMHSITGKRALKHRAVCTKLSGFTVTAWCNKNNICEQTYYRNLKVLLAEICENFPIPTEISEKPVSFKKLEVQTPVTGTRAAIVIRLNGATVEVNEGTSQQTIQAVLLALQSIC